MKFGLCRTYLSSLVPPTVGNNTVLSLRYANDIQTLQTNTQLYFNSFLPSVVRLWNDLPDEIQNSNTIREDSPPSYYNAGKRLGQIYHSRLRTKCSSLNEHLFSKNIADSSLCTCGSAFLALMLFFLEIQISRHIQTHKYLMLFKVLY